MGIIARRSCLSLSRSSVSNVISNRMVDEAVDRLYGS